LWFYNKSHALLPISGKLSATGIREGEWRKSKVIIDYVYAFDKNEVRHVTAV
jgi:hypothetical protein